MSCFLPPEESIHVYPKNLTKSLFNRMGACCTNDKESCVLPPAKCLIDIALRSSPYKKGKITVRLSFYALSFIMFSSLNLFSLLKRWNDVGLSTNPKGNTGSREETQNKNKEFVKHHLVAPMKFTEYELLHYYAVFVAASLKKSLLCFCLQNSFNSTNQKTTYDFPPNTKEM